MQGRVKWWNKKGGYGFIEYGVDYNVFVHIKIEELNNISFDEDENIEFELNQIGTNTYLKILNPKKIVEVL